MLRSRGNWLVVVLTLGACATGEHDDTCLYGCTAPITGVTTVSTGEPEESTGMAPEPTEVTPGGGSTEAGEASSSSPAETGCTVADNTCASEDALQYCDEQTGEFAVISCTEVCGAAQDALGCGIGDSGHATCFCGDEQPACDDEEESDECAGEQAIRWCEGGVWNYVDCDAWCANHGGTNVDPEASCGYTLVESCADGPSCDGGGVGGDPVCACTDAPCVQGAQYCGGPDTLRYCNDGEWLEFTCDEACELSELGEGLGCTFFLDPGIESCACTG